MKSKFDTLLKKARLRYLMSEQNEQDAAAIAASLGGTPGAAAAADPLAAAAAGDQSALPDAAMPEPEEPESQNLESAEKELYKDAVDHLVHAIHDLVMGIKEDGVSLETIRSQYIEINDEDFRAVTSTDSNNVSVIVSSIDQLANKLQTPFQRDGTNV